MENALNYDVCVKGIIIGDSGVGKSSLLYRYTEQDWNPHYIATIGVDFKTMRFEREGKVVALQLWDTAGQERFRTITQSYYRGAHAVLLVFDFSDRSSFDNIMRWMKDVRTFAADDVVLMLVGNKCDIPEAQRAVTIEEAQAAAAELGTELSMTSAKTDLNVDATFQHLVDVAVKRRMELLKKRREAVPPRPRLDGQQARPKKACEC